MKRIFKYPVVHGIGTITVPCDKDNADYPEILNKIVMQDGIPQMYIIVDPEHPDTVDFHTILVGTGHPLPPNCDEFAYIDTVEDGPFIWHIFIKEEE